MDNIYLTGPLGTQWNIGSWIEKAAGVDYGAAALIRQQLNQTAFVEGARLAYETAAGPRKMTFPIRIRGGTPNLNLIPNPSFEAGLTGWSSFVNAGGTLNDYSQSATWAYGTGKYSAHFKWTQGADTTNRVGEIFTTGSGLTGIPVAVSTAYALSAWLNLLDTSGEANPFFIAVSWYKADGAASAVTPSAQLNFTPALGVSRISGTLTSPSDAAYVQVSVGSQSNVNADVIEFYVDGVQMEVGTAANPFYELDNLTLDQVEASLRQMVRPGGYIDIQPHGVASSEMVRFDILGGDVAHRSYSVDMQRIPLRPLTLTLQTQPFGYWPTWITLATVASMPLSGQGYLPLTGPFVGDVPGLMEISVVPTMPADGYAGGAGAASHLPDGLVWGNGGRPSFLAGLYGPSWFKIGSYANGGSAGAAHYGGMGTGMLTFNTPPAASTALQLMAAYRIPSALEPAYRGRFRAFAHLADNNLRFNSYMLDAVAGTTNATAQALATGAGLFQGASWTGAALVYQFVDLGEITLPPVASGIQQAQTLRLSILSASYGATSLVELGGVYLQPLDGEAGVISGGLAWPSYGGDASAITISAAFLRSDTGPLAFAPSPAPSVPLGDLTRYYRGVMPKLGATVSQLDMIGFQRFLNGPSAAQNTFLATPLVANVSVRYRPRFSFLKGL